MLTSIALFVLLLFAADLALCSPISKPSIMRRDSISKMIQGTWQNPSDTLSILLIIGGDVVLKALAQLTGRSFTPIAFSFGWVSYSFNTLMSVLGDGRLVPAPDYPAKVINAENGYKRDSKSWVIGRLLRDFESPLGDKVGLSITVFEAVEEDLAGGAECRFVVVQRSCRHRHSACPCCHSLWATQELVDFIHHRRGERCLP